MGISDLEKELKKLNKESGKIRKDKDLEKILKSLDKKFKEIKDE